MFNFLIKAANAAADTDLVTAAASGTALINNNSSTITGFITTVWGKATITAIMLAILLLTTAILINSIRGRKKMSYEEFKKKYGTTWD